MVAKEKTSYEQDEVAVACCPFVLLVSISDEPKDTYTCKYTEMKRLKTNGHAIQYIVIIWDM